MHSTRPTSSTTNPTSQSSDKDFIQIPPVLSYQFFDPQDEQDEYQQVSQRDVKMQHDCQQDDDDDDEQNPISVQSTNSIEQNLSFTTSNSPPRRARINSIPSSSNNDFNEMEIDESLKQLIDDDNDDGLDNESHLRSLMRQISKDPNLSDSEKTRRNQILLTKRFEKRRAFEAAKHIVENNAKKESLSYSNVLDPNGDQYLLGCEHYPRNCRLLADCCNLWVVCRFCHDNSEMDHVINRFDTKRVKCMLCGTEQDIRKTCIKCGIDFARYYCDKCKFFDNTPGKEIYHCDECSICRVGNGFGKGTYHCDDCNACVSMDHKKNQQCLKNSLDANCPICMQYLFTSTKPVVFMRCGHTMHSHCFDAYVTENYRCPLCHKALTNMNPYYAMLDEAIKNGSVSSKHPDAMAEVLCHDCEKRSQTLYHEQHRRCMIPGCGSYNTRIIKIMKRTAPGNSSEADASRADNDRHDKTPPGNEEDVIQE